MTLYDDYTPEPDDLASEREWRYARHCLKHSHPNDPDYEFDDLGEEWE